MKVQNNDSFLNFYHKGFDPRFHMSLFLFHILQVCGKHSVFEKCFMEEKFTV